MFGGFENHDKPLGSWNPKRAEGSDQSYALLFTRLTVCSQLPNSLDFQVPIFAKNKIKRERERQWLIFFPLPSSHSVSPSGRQRKVCIPPGAAGRWKVGGQVCDALVLVSMGRGSMLKGQEGQTRCPDHSAPRHQTKMLRRETSLRVACFCR